MMKTEQKSFKRIFSVFDESNLLKIFTVKMKRRNRISD